MQERILFRKTPFYTDHRFRNRSACLATLELADAGDLRFDNDRLLAGVRSPCIVTPLDQTGIRMA